MKLRTPALAVLPLALLLTSCGGGSDNNKAEEPGSTPSAPQASQTSAKPGPTATTSGKPGAKASSSATSTAPSKTQAGGGAPAPGSPGATHTAPGRYTYDTKGNVTAGGQTHDASGTQVLTVDRPAGERQHSTLSSDRGEGGTEQDVLHRTDGTFLVRLKISASGYEKEFRPAKPVLGVPKPATAGRTWSWTMTSTDGKTRAAYTGKITRKETVTIGGTKVDTWLIDSTLKLSGDIDYTDRRKTNYDESRLLQVRTHSQASGSFSGIPFTSDARSTMRSVRPS